MRQVHGKAQFSIARSASIIKLTKLPRQNMEKREKLDELIISNKELAFQEQEKEKLAVELVIANRELVFQNKEKEKQAVELVIANKELAFQDEEKEKRAAELVIANKELLAYTYISTHDLQEPLRKIQTFVTIILENENTNLSEKGNIILNECNLQQLMYDLLAFPHINCTYHKFEETDLNLTIDEVKNDVTDTIQEKNATIEIGHICPANIITLQFRHHPYNLISNALKFSIPRVPAHIIIKSIIVKGITLNNICQPSIPASDEKDQLVQELFSSEKNYCPIIIKDSGIGFDPYFSERIFWRIPKIAQQRNICRYRNRTRYCKKIVKNHIGKLLQQAS